MNDSEILSEKQEKIQQNIIQHYEVIEKKILKNMEWKKRNDNLQTQIQILQSVIDKIKCKVSSNSKNQPYHQQFSSASLIQDNRDYDHSVKAFSKSNRSGNTGFIKKMNNKSSINFQQSYVASIKKPSKPNKERDVQVINLPKSGYGIKKIRSQKDALRNYRSTCYAG